MRRAAPLIPAFQATQETSPELYQQLRTALLDVDTTKVVLIAHSQVRVCVWPGRIASCG